jgi:hypothetical protein
MIGRGTPHIFPYKSVASLIWRLCGRTNINKKIFKKDYAKTHFRFPGMSRGDVTVLGRFITFCFSVPANDSSRFVIDHRRRKEDD